jgi:hypothetical protein
VGETEKKTENAFFSVSPVPRFFFLKVLRFFLKVPVVRRAHPPRLTPHPQVSTTNDNAWGDNMVEITIAVPEELAQRLAGVQDHLPEILARGLEEPSLPMDMYRHVLTFLASTPSPQAILDFELTPTMQARASELLDKNRAGQLTAREAAELNEHVHIDTLLSMLKARALRTNQTPA